jgi:hypothetical protein
MSQEENTIKAAALPKLVFAPEQKSPTLEVGGGEYVRKFDAKDQPFSVQDKEELRRLLNTGHFVEAKAAETQPAASTGSGQTTPAKTDTSGATPPAEAGRGQRGTTEQ